jgi:hypothetical protein
MQRSVVAAALLIAVLTSINAHAQCCGAATTAYYQSVAYTAYSPAVYQTYRTGWYPGYFLDRIRTRVFGAPSTYVAAYPTSYVASYPSTYVASYPSAYVASYPSSYVTSYPAYTASYGTSYAPVSSCSTCSTQTVSYAASQCCDPCTPCSTCAVSQASYQQQSGGCDCAPASTSSQPASPANGTPQPEIDPNQPVQEERSTLRQTNGSEQGGVEEPPPAEGSEAPANNASEGTDAESATYLEAPALFDPRDRTASRKISPVRKALYEKPAGYQRVSSGRTKITAEQAKRDAAGWTSAVK